MSVPQQEILTDCNFEMKVCFDRRGPSSLTKAEVPLFPRGVKCGWFITDKYEQTPTQGGSPFIPGLLWSISRQGEDLPTPSLLSSRINYPPAKGWGVFDSSIQSRNSSFVAFLGSFKASTAQMYSLPRVSLTLVNWVLFSDG